MGKKTSKAKKILGFVITTALATTMMVGTANAQTTTNNYKVAGNANTVFTDVPKDHWSKTAIDYLAKKEGFIRDMEMENLVLGTTLLEDRLLL